MPLPLPPRIGFNDFFFVRFRVNSSIVPSNPLSFLHRHPGTVGTDVTVFFFQGTRGIIGEWRFEMGGSRGRVGESVREDLGIC